MVFDREWRSKLDDLADDDSDKMNDWEVDFIESLVKQSEFPFFIPSERQMIKLGQVWRKVFEEDPYDGVRNCGYEYEY